MLSACELFPKMAKAIKESHDEVGMAGTGHDFDHALQVAQVALLIAEDERTRRLAGAAGLCHNADRILQKKLGVGKKDVPNQLVLAMLAAWLALEHFTPDDIDSITNAVLRHSGLNDPSDSAVQIALMDADRIVCSNAENVMSAAAFWRELPTIDPKWLTGDPTAHSYQNPKSILKNLECRFDWVDPHSKTCVRLPRAKQMMESRVASIRNYIKRIEAERTEMGLWPNYPEI